MSKHTDETPRSTTGLIIGVAGVLVVALIYVLTSLLSPKNSLAPGYPGPEVPTQALSSAVPTSLPADVAPWKQTSVAEAVATAKATWTVSPDSQKPIDVLAPTSVGSGPLPVLQRNAGQGRIVDVAVNDMVIGALGFVPTNRWVQVSEKSITLVWAGAEISTNGGDGASGSKKETGFGVVRVETYNTTPRTDADWFAKGPSEAQTIRSDTPLGDFFIVDELPGKLVIKAQEGSTWEFVLASRKLSPLKVESGAARDAAGGKIDNLPLQVMASRGSFLMSTWTSTLEGKTTTLLVGGVLTTNATEATPLVARSDKPSGAIQETDIQLLEAPKGAKGPLWVFDATKDKVVLRDAAMAIFVFDASQNRFLSQEEVDKWGGLTYGPLVP